MYMTVFNFFAGGVTDFNDFYIKVELYAGQRVVAIDRYLFTFNGGNCYHDGLSARALGVETPPLPLPAVRATTILPFKPQPIMARAAD